MLVSQMNRKGGGREEGRKGGREIGRVREGGREGRKWGRSEYPGEEVSEVQFEEKRLLLDPSTANKFKELFGNLLDF